MCTYAESVVPRMLSQEPVILSHRIKRLSVTLRSRNKPLSFFSYAASRSFFPSRLSSSSVCRWSALENAPPPITARTSSALPLWDLNYFSCSDVTGFRSTSPDFLTSILLRDPTMGERVFVFLKKRQGKKVSQIIFSTLFERVSSVTGDTLYKYTL